MRAELSQKFLAAVKPTPDRIERYFDTEKKAPRGFLLRITPAGARAWALQYREKNSGRQREITIGDVKSWPIAEARRRGHELRREIDAGGDPLADREKQRTAPTVQKLIERFETEALARTLTNRPRAESTQREYRTMLRDWVGPALGHLKVAAVDSDDIKRLHQKITEAGKLRRANAVQAVCSILFSQAIAWKMRDTNPCSRLQGNPEHGRERYLSGAEIETLMAVLERWQEKRPDSVDAIMLAMLTGARRGEILKLRWIDADLDAAVWSMPAPITKQRKPHRAPLSPPVVELLRRRKTERTNSNKVVRLHETDDVFRGGGSRACVALLERDWGAIRAEAGLEGVRFHDLRHTFASMLIGNGLSLPIIGRLLGHAKPATTARYAHIPDRPLREAAEIVGTIVGGGRKNDGR